jgi:primosomal protein N'
VLSLDRPFTYSLPESLEAGVGSLVKVPFHGRPVKGWILGPTEDLPKRMLDVRSVESGVRFFDTTSLRLLQWAAERYVSPLATVIGRSHPPRVVSEEAILAERPDDDRRQSSPARISEGRGRLSAYRNGPALAEAVSQGLGLFVLRPAPADEVALAVEAAARCLAGGRRVVLLVPESNPMPATASAMVEAFEDRVALYMGKQSKRARYRMWLEIKAGRYDVVIGTRPGSDFRLWRGRATRTIAKNDRRTSMSAMSRWRVGKSNRR